MFVLYPHQYTNLCNLTENEGISAPVPDFLFELEYCDHMNARFEKTRAGRDVFYAFHGSRLENFHSIIHNGLHCHLNKVSAVTTASCQGCPLDLQYATQCSRLLLSFVVQRLWNGCGEIRGLFLLVASRTQCLERGHTSPVTSAWLSSTAPTAVAGRKASWVLCSAVLPCVKSLITQMLSARWRKKVRWSWDSLTQTLKHITLMFKPSRSMISHFRFRNHWPSALQS